jgi:hypothetical protein
MTLLLRIEALRNKLRRAAESDEGLELEVDDDSFDALGTIAKEIAARGVVFSMPSIRVARPSGRARVPFRWPRPSSAVVKLESDKSGKIGCCEYRIEFDENGVLRHSDFRITNTRGAKVSWGFRARGPAGVASCPSCMTSSAATPSRTMPNLPARKAVGDPDRPRVTSTRVKERKPIAATVWTFDWDAP